MTASTAPAAASPPRPRLARLSRRFGPAWLALSPTVLATAVCFYGCIAWMVYISFTRSRLLPNYEWAGLVQYERLMTDERWHVAMGNLLVFGGLMIVFTLALGGLMAIFMDQKIRFEGTLRTVYMYPLAMSYVVTGLAWQWLLNAEYGLQQVVRDLGLPNFQFDWLADPDMAIYTVVIAGVWHSAGLVMAILLAGLRNIDTDIWRAAAVDGVPTWRVYLHVVLPMLAPVVSTCVVLLALSALRGYDLVVAITGGGPGYASDLPGKYVVDYASERANLGLAAAAAVEMLGMLLLLLAPAAIARRLQARRAARAA